MKKITYLFYLLCFSVVITSCETDTPSITNPGVFTPSSEVFISFTDANDNQSLLEGESVTYTVSLSSPLSSDATISFNMESSDGSVEASFGSVIIPSGETTADVTVSFTDDGIIDTMETYTFSIADVAYTTSPDIYLTYDGVGRTATVNNPPLTVTTSVADVDFEFNWTGTSDLDCRIRDAALNDVDTGYSTSPGETVTLSAGAADGVYTFSIRPWTVADSDIDYTIDFVHPDGTLALDGGLTGLSAGFWAEEFTVLEITKETDGSDVTYTFVQL